MAGCYANPEALIEPTRLGKHLDDAAVRVIEVGADTRAYARGHIPGALAWNWYADLTCPGQGACIDQPALARLLARAGVDSATTVVLYGGSDNRFAAAAFWLLRYLGFPRVALLNGGRSAWERHGWTLVRDIPAYERTVFSLLGPRHEHLRATRDRVLGIHDRTCFIDVRMDEEGRGVRLNPDPAAGRRDPGRRWGRIPGTVHIPWDAAVREDGSFKPADELWPIYTQAVAEASEVIVCCLTGACSAHTWFVLKELLGVRRVRNYDNAWSA